MLLTHISSPLVVVWAIGFKAQLMDACVIVLGVYGIRATGKEVGFCFKFLIYPRKSSSLLEVIPAKLSPLLAYVRCF